MTSTMTKAPLRKIAVRKAGTVRLTSAAASIYADGCVPPGLPPIPWPY